MHISLKIVAIIAVGVCGCTVIAFGETALENEQFLMSEDFITETESESGSGATEYAKETKSTKRFVTFNRTIIFIKMPHEMAKYVFINGGSGPLRGCLESRDEESCSVPIRHNPLPEKISSAAPYRAWKELDRMLEWQGAELGQGTYMDMEAEGTPMFQVDYMVRKYGEIFVSQPQLLPGVTDLWMVDLGMDCTKSLKGWVEFRVTAVTGQGVSVREKPVRQERRCQGVHPHTPPYRAQYHTAACGKLNIFKFNKGMCTVLEF